MRVVMSLASSLTIGVLSVMPSLAQEKLPGILKTNTILVGQLYGCLSRVENYAKISASFPDSKFKVEDATKIASSVLGADIAMIKADLVRLKNAFPTAQDIQKFDDMIFKISQAELKEPDGYPWAQSASCAYMIHNLGLYDKYPFNQN